MADYGIEVYDPSGGLVFDTRKKGWVLIDLFTVAGTASETRSYTAYAGRTIGAIAVEKNSGASIAYNHTVSVSGITVNITDTPMGASHRQLIGAQSTPDSTVYVFVR